MLDRSLLDVMVAGVFVAIGVGATVLYRLRSRHRDQALLWFGVFSILYGVRILARAEAFRDAFTFPEIFWWYLASAITYVIALPIMLMLWEIFPTWRTTLRFLLWSMAIFGVYRHRFGCGAETSRNVGHNQQCNRVARAGRLSIFSLQAPRKQPRAKGPSSRTDAMQSYHSG